MRSVVSVLVAVAVVAVASVVAVGGGQSGAVRVVLERGWFQGYADGEFRADQRITESEIARVLERVRPGGWTRGEFAELLVGGADAVRSLVNDTSATTTTSTAPATTTTAPAVDFVAPTEGNVIEPQLNWAFFAELECAGWLDQREVRSVNHLRQMVFLSAEWGFEWPQSHDKTGDGYPCVEVLGVGFLPPPPPPPAPIIRVWLTGKSPLTFSVTADDGMSQVVEVVVSYHDRWEYTGDKCDLAETGEPYRRVSVPLVDGRGVFVAPPHPVRVCDVRGVYAVASKLGCGWSEPYWQCEDEHGTRDAWVS